MDVFCTSVYNGTLLPRNPAPSDEPKGTRLGNKGAESSSTQSDIYRAICCSLRGFDLGAVGRSEGKDGGDRLGLECGAKLLLRHDAAVVDRSMRSVGSEEVNVAISRVLPGPRIYPEAGGACPGRARDNLVLKRLQGLPGGLELANEIFWVVEYNDRREADVFLTIH